MPWLRIRMRLPELAPLRLRLCKTPSLSLTTKSKSWLRQPSRHSRTLKIRIPRTNRINRTRTNRTRTNRKVDNLTLFCQPSTDRTQRVGIVMIPLACAFSGVAKIANVLANDFHVFRVFD